MLRNRAGWCGDKLDAVETTNERDVPVLQQGNSFYMLNPKQNLIEALRKKTGET